MNDSKSSFNVLASIEKHTEALKPLLPKQAIIGIGEYPIKTLLKETSLSREGTLPIFIEKSSDDIYKWIPKGYETFFVLGFEDSNIDTHFWYNVLPTITKDPSLMYSLKKKSTEKLHGAIIFSSIWDGVGSAALPALISKFKKRNVDTLSIAVVPSKIQPADAHFNAYATLQMCLAAEGSTVLLLGRDQLETFDGVDRRGEQIKGNLVVNYLLNLFLEKELLVQEIAELSRTFNVKLFSAVAVTAASYRVYGSLENMLDTALLKPLFNFDLSSASLLYVLIRMPRSLKDKLPRVKIELAITNWFKKRTSPQSIHITEPIYTEDTSDRIDAVLFIGGFDTTQIFREWDTKVEALKTKAVEKGYMTEDWQLLFKVEEEPEPPETPAPVEPAIIQEPPQTPEQPQLQPAEPTQPVEEQPKAIMEAQAPMEASAAPVEIEEVTVEKEPIKVEEPTESVQPEEVAEIEKPKRARKPKKAKAKTEEPQPEAAPEPVEVSQPEKPKRVRRNRKAQNDEKVE